MRRASTVSPRMAEACATRATSNSGAWLNHLYHHRAQLTMYLRLNEKPVPSPYGPSAGEPYG
jgi:hypothetical protein